MPTVSKRTRWKLYDIQWPMNPQQVENINSNFDRLYADLFAADYSSVWSDGVLAPAYGGTGLSTPFVIGDILYADSVSSWARLAAGTANYVLKSGGAGSAPSWGPLLHALLDSTLHTDTVTGTVARGDLITGQAATPKWTRLARGTAGQFLRSDGTDLAWSTNGSALTNIPETAITDGAILARVAAHESISGNWTFAEMKCNNTSGTPNGFINAWGYTGTYSASVYHESYYNGYKFWIKDISGSGSSYGIRIDAGKVAADYVIRVVDRTASPADLFYLKGDGSYYFRGALTTSGAQNWARAFLMRAGFHG